MKKILYSLVMVLVLFSMASCKTQKELTEEEKTQIQEDWRKEHDGNIGIYFYLGEQKGYKILFYDSFDTAIGSEKIDEYVFIYPCLFTIYAYKDGTFEQLRDVYDEGFLNHNDIKAIHKSFLSFMNQEFPDFYEGEYKNK